jgi:hypothetical protein
MVRTVKNWMSFIAVTIKKGCKLKTLPEIEDTNGRDCQKLDVTYFYDC